MSELAARNRLLDDALQLVNEVDSGSVNLFERIVDAAAKRNVLAVAESELRRLETTTSSLQRVGIELDKFGLAADPQPAPPLQGEVAAQLAVIQDHLDDQKRSHQLAATAHSAFAEGLPRTLDSVTLPVAPIREPIVPASVLLTWIAARGLESRFGHVNAAPLMDPVAATIAAVQFTIPGVLRATVTVRARRPGAQAPSGATSLVEEARLLGQGGYSLGEVMVVGANEDTVHGPSAHHVFQVITARANVIMRQMKMRGAALEFLLHWTAWLGSYSTLFTRKCEMCGRLLQLDSQQHRYLPPCERILDLSGRSYLVYHSLCHSA